MKKNLLVTVALCCMLFPNEQLNAQDIHFSQFYENAILRNPALTGIFSGDYKAGVNYRTQWGNISVPFRTILASAETRIRVNKEVGDYISFGLTTTYDRAGTINFSSFQVYPAINYNKAMEGEHNTYLSMGFTGGYIQRTVDLTKATYSTQYVNGAYNVLNNSGESLTNNSIQNYDLGFGVSVNSSLGADNQANYYVGASAFHLTKPRQAFNGSENYLRMETKWSGNAGLKYNINEQYAITSHFNYLQQGKYMEMIGGGFISWRSIDPAAGNFTLYTGAFARYKDAIIPTFKVDYQNYSLTCSYDINTSPLKVASNNAGGFEMSLFIRGNYNRSYADKQVRCPHFEQMLPAF